MSGMRWGAGIEEQGYGAVGLRRLGQYFRYDDYKKSEHAGTFDLGRGGDVVAVPNRILPFPLSGKSPVTCKVSPADSGGHSGRLSHGVCISSI